MSTYPEELQGVVDWLAHPNELGRAPSSIEFVKEFTDPEGANCKIFRFKSGLLSPWMMAINSDSGIFSEFEKYDKKNDVAQAQKLLDYLKQYWKNMALNEEEKKERAKKATPFVSFVLKAESKFEPKEFLRIYENDWGEKLTMDGSGEEEEGTNDKETCFFANKDGLQLVLGYMDCRIPDDEAEFYAKYNFMWKDAVETTKKHKAHVLVSVMGNGTAIEKAFYYSKALVSLCQIENNIGVYGDRTVNNPKYVVSLKNKILEGTLPIPILVWCGLGLEQEGISGWTCGMKHFGFDEMEIINVKKEPSAVQGFLLILIDYCLNNDISFHDGETVGLAANVQLQVTRSKGINVEEEGETLKITMP